MNFLRRHPHIIFLLLAPSLFVELSSGFQTPMQFFFPLMLFIMVVAYGFPALLIGDAIARWKLSFSGVALLGIAYGIYNEGILAKTLYNGFAPDEKFNDMGAYLDVIWPWTIAIIITHAFLSMAFPIFLARHYFSEQVGAVFLSQKKRMFLLLGTIALGILMYFSVDTGKEQPGVYFFTCVGIIALLVYVAKRSFGGRGLVLPPGGVSWWAVVSGALLVVVYLFAPHIVMGSMGKQALAVTLSYLIVAGGFLYLVIRMGWYAQPTFILFIFGSFLGLAIVGVFFALSQGRVDSIIWNIGWTAMLVYFIRKLASEQKGGEDGGEQKAALSGRQEVSG